MSSTCTKCRGQGYIGCEYCDESGYTDNDETQGECHYCRGGKIVECPECSGHGYVED